MTRWLRSTNKARVSSSRFSRGKSSSSSTAGSALSVSSLEQSWTSYFGQPTSSWRIPRSSERSTWPSTKLGLMSVSHRHIRLPLKGTRRKDTISNRALNFSTKASRLPKKPSRIFNPLATHCQDSDHSWLRALDAMGHT